MVLLGIDLGTSAMKVMLFDPDSSELVQEREPLDILQPTPDLAEADPNAWWAALVNVLQRLRSRHAAAFDAVEAIGISTIFPALVPMDTAGAPLRNSLLYCDRRSVPQVEALAERLGRDRFESLTGNQLTPGTCTLPGIVWLRENEPDVFGATHVFGQASTFLVRQLTGSFAVDMTHASLSGMVRSGCEGEWDPELLDLAGIGPERLPELCSATEVVGQVTGAAAAQCGLRQGIPVVAGAGDAPLAAFGGGTFAAHQLFCSAGTTDCIMFTGARPCGNPVFANVRYVLPELWVSIGTMSTAGASVKWLCERLMHGDAETVTTWAETAEPGAGGLVFLPYLQGERTPWWDPKAQGVFCGLSLSTRREELCRAVFEGVAFGWKQIISLLEEEYGFRASEVIAVGGGSTNRLWNQIKASVLNLPVRVLRFTETTSLGAALIAGIGAGTIGGAEDARRMTVGLLDSTATEPHGEWVERYVKPFAVYRELYPTMRELFQA